MTAFGFCVVAALSSQISGRPCTRSSRIGKSRRTRLASSGRFEVPRSNGTRLGRNSSASSREVAGEVSAPFCGFKGEGATSVAVMMPEAGTTGSGVAVRKSASVDGADGIEVGNAGTPGADCMPGTPGKENNSLNDGSDDAAPGYTVFPTSAKASVEPDELVDEMPRSSGDVFAGTAGVSDFTS